jgi:hypothetical protein
MSCRAAQSLNMQKIVKNPVIKARYANALILTLFLRARYSKIPKKISRINFRKLPRPIPVYIESKEETLSLISW